MRKFKKPLIIILVLGTLIGLIIVFFIINSQPDTLNEQQKEKAIGQILGRKPNLNPDNKTGNVTYSGKYAVFSYPARAKIYEYSNVSGNKYLESFSFDIDQPRLILNYNVEEVLPSLSIHDIPSVRLREDGSRGYDEIEISAKNKKGLGFFRDGGTGDKSEATGFFLENSRIYTFSVLGNNIEDTKKLFDSIIESLTIR